MAWQSWITPDIGLLSFCDTNCPEIFFSCTTKKVGMINRNRLVNFIAEVWKIEVRKKDELPKIISCILPLKKDAIHAGDKNKPGSAASFRVI